MDSRASGYITEVGYAHSYFPELAPGALSLAALNGGASAHAAKPLRYLELGFGQGLSLNIHAAACPGEYWGIDINPDHIATATAMAEASGSGVHVLEASFADLLARPDVPDFDIIAAHGIWTWVSAEHRSAIVDIVRRKLANGGMFYLSYNCMPGWSAATPLRHLLTLHADLAVSGGKGILDRVEGAIDFAQRVAATGIGYFKANPAAVSRLNTIRTQNPAHVAHEFFNRDWTPMPFSQVAELLAPAHVSFAASANLFHHLDGISLPASARKLLGEIDHPVLRQSVRDYLLNVSFRRDIFVKGLRPMLAPERQALYLNERFVLTRGAEFFTTFAGGTKAVITVNEAEITLQQDFYQPLIEALAEDNYAPRMLQELATHRRLRGRDLPSLIMALIILTAAGVVLTAQNAEAVGQARPRCKALNAHLMARLPAAGEPAFFASPVSGGGVTVSRTEMLFMRALRSGSLQPEEWARFARAHLDAKGSNSGSNSGPNAAPDTKPGAPHEENLADLIGEAKDFGTKRLPVLRALEVV